MGTEGIEGGRAVAEGMEWQKGDKVMGTGGQGGGRGDGVAGG